MAAPNSVKKTEKKSIPAAIQLARAIKCLDIFGKHDPEAAAFYAQRKVPFAITYTPKVSAE